MSDGGFAYLTCPSCCLGEAKVIADIKTKLRKQLIELRDGDRWKELESLLRQELQSFELLAKIKGQATFNLGEAVAANVESDDWARFESESLAIANRFGSAIEYTPMTFLKKDSPREN